MKGNLRSSLNGKHAASSWRRRSEAENAATNKTPCPPPKKAENFFLSKRYRFFVSTAGKSRRLLSRSDEGPKRTWTWSTGLYPCMQPEGDRKSGPRGPSSATKASPAAAFELARRGGAAEAPSPLPRCGRCSWRRRHLISFFDLSTCSPRVSERGLGLHTGHDGNEQKRGARS